MVDVNCGRKDGRTDELTAKAGATKMREDGKNIGIFDILTFEILMKY